MTGLSGLSELRKELFPSSDSRKDMGLTTSSEGVKRMMVRNARNESDYLRTKKARRDPRSVLVPNDDRQTTKEKEMRKMGKRQKGRNRSSNNDVKEDDEEEEEVSSPPSTPPPLGSTSTDDNEGTDDRSANDDGDDFEFAPNFLLIIGEENNENIETKR